MSSNPPISQLEKDERMWGLLVHIIPYFALGFIFPLVIMLIKPHQSEFIYHHAKQALIFQICLTIAAIITFALCFVLVGFLLLPVVGILGIVGPIYGAVKANEGEWYRFPIIGGAA